MVKTMLKVLCGVALLMLVLSAPAYADTIVVFNNGNGCGNSTCFGNNVTLLIHPNGGTSYTVTLTVDTSGNTNAGTGIGGVDFKFGSGGIVSVDAFNSAPGGTANWSAAVTNGLNANGCTTTNGSTFGCSLDSGFMGTIGATPFAPVATNGSTGTYTWSWDVTVTAFNPATDQIHVGVLFGTGAAKQGKSGKISFVSTGIISASGLGSQFPPPGNPVPEPGSLMLFGTGLIGLGGLLRWRMR